MIIEGRKWTLADMIKASRSMKRKSKIIAKRRVQKLKRFADTKTLERRALQSLKMQKKKKLAGGKDYGDLSLSQRLMLIKKLDKILPRLKKIAKRMVKVKRQQEIARHLGLGKK